MSEKRIIQIIPADGWYAVYTGCFDDGARGQAAWRFPCWGLFEEEDSRGGIRYVQGIDVIGREGGYDSVEDSSNFERYVHKDDAEWICKICSGFGDCDHKVSNNKAARA